jgi:hypothetical protein
MRRGVGCFVLVVVWGLWGSAQEGQQKPQELAQQQRPTLGPAPAPSLYGPRTSTTTDARKLARIRTLYVERIDNLLSEKLVDGLGRMTRFRVVASRREADAIVHGSCADFRRLKSVHSEVYITDPNGASVWQDSVRRPFNPPPLDRAVNETALLILEHLSDSVREADRK